MYQEYYSVLNLNEILKIKFKNCICEDSSIKVINNSKEEYNSLRYGVGIRIFNPAVIQLKGKDSLDFLHRISTNDLKNLKTYEKINTLFLNEKGRFIDRTTLLSMNDYFILIGLNDNTKKLFNWINKYIITEDIETHDVTSSYILAEIIGPQSESFLTMILNEKLDRTDEPFNALNENKVITIINGTLKYDLFLHKEMNELNIYKVLLEKNQLGDFIDYIFENKSIFDLNFVGEDAYQVFRVEMGIPDVSEINLNFNPHEINLLNEVSFTKGCYIGQEVVARLETYDKVQRKLCGVIFENDESIPGEITDLDGEDAGIITSVVNSEFLNKKIGLAVIRKKFLDKQNFECMLNHKKINLRIVSLPFER